MKRRKFIWISVGLTAYGLLPGSILGNPLVLKNGYTLEAYDDNTVVRVYNSKVTNYDFLGSIAYRKTIDPKVLKQMLSKSLLEISGEKNSTRAWKKILSGDNRIDLSKKKVAIKVNFNNTIRDIDTTLNNSPAMMGALTKSLKEAGIEEENIYFFDCSRPFPDEFKNEVREQGFDKVVMIGKNDNPSVSEKTIFLSDNEGFIKKGRPSDQFPIPQLLIDADYLVNLHLVKIHQTGVTGSMKNLYGLAQEVGFYVHNGPRKRFEVSYQLPDISLDKEIKKRARLNIAEFIFGGHTPDTINKFTNEAFFPGGIPASLIVSRSPFYHDTVLYGMIKAEYETCVPVLERYCEIGPDKWLSNSAERYSGWKYDQAIFTDKVQHKAFEKDLSFRYINYKSLKI